ncbi:hypothetical protein M7I_3082 [Glarea lozoyensis 74030]|uniref:Uncharacterized protein n=1 Tax=Glarea lozoyensis (strain ATCC 74030 / MF5533) TaxID=1104152 RepID=H0EKI4_GLAL7|nr:hypothetical protein M7I_3082 [Glarea lozoyensis 74030]
MLQDELPTSSALEDLLKLELLHNKVWKEELFEASREKFSRDLLKFIEPLTKIFRVTECPLAELRGTIVDSALELWSYLQCLRGNLELIIPSRGDIFNPKEHDVVDAYSSRMEPWKATNKKVFLVRSPGLRWWPEISGCGKPVVALVLKARVIFDL